MTDRIKPVTGEVKIEIMSPVVTLQWNPTNNTGSVTYNMAKYILIDGVAPEDLQPSPAGMLTTDLMSNIHRTYVTPGMLNESGQDISLDPVTGADLSMISAAGVMSIIKAAFATSYAEAYPGQAAPTPTPTPTPPEPSEPVVTPSATPGE
jgi:hypothetical protein